MKLKPTFGWLPGFRGNGHAHIEPKPVMANSAMNGGVHFGKNPFTNFQSKFAKFAKRLKKAAVPQKIRSKIESYVNRGRMLLGASFRGKVLLPVVGCMAGVLAAIFFVVEHQLAQQSEKEARKTLATANAVIRYSQDFRRNDLLLRFHNLPNVPLWNRVFQSGAPRDLHNTMRDLMEMQKVDIVFYASNRGKILDAVNNPAVPASEFEDAAAPVLQLALRGDEKVDTVRVAGKLYDVVALPAYDSDNKQTGALALGSELGDATLQTFSKLTQGQVALLANGHVIASTLPGSDANAQFLGAFKGAMPVNDNADPAANIKPVVLNGVHYYSIAGRFKSLAGDTS